MKNEKEKHWVLAQNVRTAPFRRDNLYFMGKGGPNIPAR